MTSLTVRKVRTGRGVVKLKLIRVAHREVRGGVGVMKRERVQVICSGCGQQVEAVASDGRVKGYCAVARQVVDFLPEISAAQKKGQ